MTRIFHPDNSGHFLRRTIFFTLVGVTTLLAMGLLTVVFQKDGINGLELLLLLLYVVLFTWICLSFWTAFTGFCIYLCGYDRFAISKTQQRPLSPDVKIAIVMPAYNEDPRHVFAGLQAICDSLLQTGQQARFDCFLLSDTRDPEIWLEEELRWYALHHQWHDKIKIFYRNREHNSERKVGNLKDFCTRWGGNYRYMIVLDADSVMNGDTLINMVNVMEQNPRVALLQVPPTPVNKESLFARIQQFASSVYSPIFTAGLNFWQLSEGNYWGHNAIIRIEPFVQHCGLPKLPGKEPFGGEILSHDFVEAALLRRAGWEVWLGYDMKGSYEEIPPTLIDYAKRDRRWCQGNLQHTRLLFAKGVHPIHRLHLLTGIMSYLASPLWLLFLIVTGIDAYIHTQIEPVYFFGTTLFPIWPVSYTVEMTTVLIVTLTILFLPKFLGLLLLLKSPQQVTRYGGALKVSLSVILETISSLLLAPILMLFQTKFVVAILLRRNIRWAEQQRDDHQTRLKEALFAHGGHTVIGLSVGIFSYYHITNFFWWLTPVLAGLILSIPLSMFLSNVHFGKRARAFGLFLIPEESQPPYTLERLHYHLQQERIPPVERYGSRFMQVVLEPATQALHTALLPTISLNRRQRHYLEGLMYQLLEEGIASLNTVEKRALLANREMVYRLHVALWLEIFQVSKV